MELYYTDNDTEILDLMADNGIALDDNADRVLSFLLDGNLHLVLYCSAPGDKGFMMYRIDAISENWDRLSELKQDYISCSLV